jgi:hypothetical protein
MKEKKEKKHAGKADSTRAFKAPDHLSETYYSGVTFTAASGPLPVSKKRERKKTETIRRAESGQADL